MEERPPPAPAPTGAWSTLAVVEEWRAGDAAALGRLAERLTPLLLSRVAASKTMQRLRGRVAEEDVVQEVWARVLRSGPGAFEPTGEGRPFLAWLAQITDHTLVDLLRQVEARKRGGSQGPAALDTRVADQPLRRPGQASLTRPSAVARMQEFEAVAARTLTERELLAWRWVVLEGYTSAEAAVGLDCTPAAVRSLLVRSRAKLAEALG